MDGTTIFELARKKAPPPDTLTLPEMMLFTTARNIYKAFADGVISLEQAQSEKDKVIRLFNENAHAENESRHKREQLFRISGEISDAIKSAKTVKHTHMGISVQCTIKGAIALCDKIKGWTYSLVLQELNSGTIIYAALEETEV